jgi:ketosteroid isomerase-like protein
MVAKSPAEAVRLADGAFNRGDSDAMLDLYERDAVMLFEPGRVVRGRAALADALRGLLKSQLTARHHATTSSKPASSRCGPRMGR